MKAFSSEESVLYPNIGYEMELVGDLSIDRELSFQEIALYLEDKHRRQELTLSDVNHKRYTPDDATDVDGYLKVCRDEIGV